MKKITTYNYEAFYLDYLENNLSDEGTKILFEFLNQYPDLKADLEFDDDILEYTLPTDFKTTLKQNDKEDLKHCEEDEICLKNIDEFIIADIENQLLPNKKQELYAIVKKYQLEPTVIAYQSTKLKPNMAEVYPNKKELKHQTKVIPLLIRISAVAALLLLLFNVIDFNSSNQNKYQQRQAKYQYKKPNFKVDSINNNQQIETEQQTEQIAKTDVNKTKIKTKNSKTPTNIITPEENLQPNQIVKQQKINNKQKVDTSSNINNNPKVIPFKVENQLDENNDIASTNSSEKTTSNIKLVDMYPPITQVANNYTSLNVMAKKSTPESEFQVTQIRIGNFSFERKKKR
jgi:hypothetical protein